jgi:hypothetical protein
LTITAPPAPAVRLSIGVTGHRAGNAAFAANDARIELVLGQVFDLMQSALGEGTAPVRLHCLLADGADQIAARGGLGRGWELIAPLPFGRDLNVAINAVPERAPQRSANWALRLGSLNWLSAMGFWPNSIWTSLPLRPT